VSEKDVSGVASAVADHFGTTVISYGRFMTHKVHIHEREYDFAAARIEYYDFPGSLPTVAPTSLIKDLLRRDFTVNALAMSLSSREFGKVVDATGGLQDLEQHIIRMTYPESFIEDPARILRAISIQLRLGFTLDAGTRQKAREALELGLLNVRRNKRAQEEFKEMLSGAGAVSRIRTLCTFGCEMMGLPLTPPGYARQRILTVLEFCSDQPAIRLSAPAWVAPLLVWLGNPAPQELHEILKDFGLSDRLATACSSWNGKERALRRLLMQRSVHVSDVAERLARLPSPVVSILQAKLEVAKATEAQALLTHALSALERNH